MSSACLQSPTLLKVSKMISFLKISTIWSFLLLWYITLIMNIKLDKLKCHFYFLSIIVACHNDVSQFLAWDIRYSEELALTTIAVPVNRGWRIEGVNWRWEWQIKNSLKKSGEMRRNSSKDDSPAKHLGTCFPDPLRFLYSWSQAHPW